METAETQITIRQLAVGTRLVVQCKKDWRTAVVSAVLEDKVVLQICSPSGRTYRKSCAAETIIYSSSSILFLGEGVWQENFVKYDFRW